MWSAVASRVGRRKHILSNENSQLDRCMTLFDLTALGIGSTLGVGIYVLAGAVAKDVAGPSVVLSFLVAGVTSALSGLCYAELGARVPKAGSAYVYSYVTIGEGVAFVIGWNLILEYAIGTASVARAYSGYIDSLLNKSIANAFHTVMPMNVPYLSPYPDLCAFVITLILTLILCIGVKESTRFNNIFTCLNIGVVLFVTVFGLINADFANWNIAQKDLPDTLYGTGGFFPYGISGTLAGAATCFYGFVGFDTIATSGEEAQNPQRNIPLAIIMSLAMVFLGYFGVSSALTLMIPYYEQDPSAPLPFAFHQVGWAFAGWIVSAGALFGLSTSLLGAMFPLPRVLYAMSSDGVLFKWLAHVHPNYQTPFRATVTAGILSGLMATFFDLKSLVDMMSIGTLMAYTVVAFGVIILRYEVNEDQRTDYIALTRNSEDSEDSEDEIVYCSDETLALQKAKDDKAKQPSLARQMAFPFLTKGEATPVSATAATLLTLIATLSSLTLAVVLIFGLHNRGLQSFAVILAFLTVLASFWTWLQPVPEQHLSFRVPLVPILPNVSIFINLYLMFKLSPATWVRFTVWMSIGAIIYIAYGWHHSSEEIRMQGGNNKKTAVVN